MESDCNFSKIVDFIFEIEYLKKQQHNGIKIAGVKNPDSVAEHSFCASQLHI